MTSEPGVSILELRAFLAAKGSLDRELRVTQEGKDCLVFLKEGGPALCRVPDSDVESVNEMLDEATQFAS